MSEQLLPPAHPTVHRPSSPSPKLVAWLEQSLQQLQGCRVGLLGDALLDGYVHGETARVSREAPVLIVRKQGQSYRLGGAANVAANLQAFGVDVTLLTCIGQDGPGEQLLTLLQQANIDTQHVVRCPTWTTACKTRILAGAQGACKQQILRLDDEPQWPLAEQASVQLQAHVEQLMADLDVLVISDYGTGVLTDSLCHFVQQIDQDKLPCIVDSRYRLHAFQGAYAIKPNLPEAEAAVGFPLHSPQAIERAGKQLLEQSQSRLCLLTQGRQGMVLFRADFGPVAIPSVGPKDITDVTGAGDTVLATFAAGLAAQLDPIHAMCLANCAASVVVQKPGTAVATAHEMIDVALHHQHEYRAWPPLYPTTN